jgi:hypothetical protein
MIFLLKQWRWRLTGRKARKLNAELVAQLSRTKHPA